MPSIYNTRPLPAVVYAAQQRQTIELHRDGVLVQLNLRLRYTITNGGTGPTGPLFQAVSRILKKIEIVVNGRDTPISIDGPGALARAFLEFGCVSYGADVPVSVTAAQTTVVDLVVPVPLWAVRGRRPDDTGLDLRGIQQATLAVTWGVIADIFTTPGATAAIGTPTLEVEGEYLMDAPVNNEMLVRALDWQDVDVAATNNNFEVIQDKGTGLFYRSFMVVALADNDQSTAILDSGSIKLLSGQYVFHQRGSVMLKASNKRNFQREDITIALSKHLLTSVYFLQLMAWGEATQVINSGALNADLRLVFDVTKTGTVCKLLIYREAIRRLYA